MGIRISGVSSPLDFIRSVNGWTSGHGLMGKATRNQILLVYTGATLDSIIWTYAFSRLFEIDSGLLSVFYTVEGVILASLALSKLLAEEKPELEIEQVRNGALLGFCLTVRHKTLHNPEVTCNNYSYELLGRDDRPVNKPYMHVDSPYKFYPLEVVAERPYSDVYRVAIRDAKTGAQFVSDQVLAKPHQQSAVQFTGKTPLSIAIRFVADELTQEWTYALSASVDFSFPLPNTIAGGFAPQMVKVVFQKVKKSSSAKGVWKRLGL